VGEPLSYHFDLVSGAQPGDADPPARADSSRAVAEYLADMISQLESMARLSGFDLLVYLLSMARVEAEGIARNTGDSSRHLNY
jgi:hypothetical protein